MNNKIIQEDICVLIPAYNESSRIGKVVEKSGELVRRVLVVDDGSSDGTATVASAAGAEVIRNQSNQGKGAAIRAGFRRLLAGDCRAVIVLDADGQHDPEEIPNLILEAEETGADIVIGNRMSGPSGMPLIRCCTNRLMSAILSWICRHQIPDSQCGYRLIRREVLEKLCLRTSNYDTESEMLLEASRLGFKIGSVPIRTIYGGQASTIHPFRDTLRFIRLVVRSLRLGRKLD